MSIQKGREDPGQNITRLHHKSPHRYDSPDRGTPDQCKYVQNKVYVVYSAVGSFFIPMVVMIYVYAQISCVIARRHLHMTETSVHTVSCRQELKFDQKL